MTTYLKNAEAADYLGIAPATLRKWVHKRLIPFRKHGAKVIFCTDDLDAWSEHKRVDVIEDEHDNLLSSLTSEYNSELG